jgi:F-type H+-transporting ATPase subunit b
MRFDWWTLALQTVNFAVLVWLLQRLLYKPVLRAIDSRRGELDTQRAAAARAEAEAKAGLATINVERAGIAAERAQAEREAAALLDVARKTLAAERGQALAEARHAALDLGMEVARRLLAEVPTEVRAQVWLARIEQHLAGLSESERAGFRTGLNGGKLRVVTAMPLPEPVANEWREHLIHALGQDVSIIFDVDETLVAGAELYLPQAILRFSWRSILAAMPAEIEIHGNAR